MTAGTITIEGLSEETGESLDRLREWHELGLLPGDQVAFDRLHIERVGMIRFAADRGVSPRDLAALMNRQGDLLELFVGTLPTQGRGDSYTFDEAAATAGIDPGFMERMRAAAGLRDQPRAYPEDIEAMGWLSAAVQAGMPEEAVLQIVRVFGDSATRAAEAANRLFHAYVHEGFRAEGMSGPDLIAATQSVGEPLQALVEPAVLYFHRKAWERALKEDLLLHLAEEVTPPTAVPGQLVRTILFADLSGFTPLTEAMGDAVAARIANRFSELVRDAAAAHQGQVVKQIGDEFMLVFNDGAPAIACALAIERAASFEPNFPAVRSGAHSGPVLYREADYVGATVNLASRVASVAQGHQVVLTEEVRSQATGLPDVQFSFVGRRELKGVLEPIDLFLAEPVGDRPTKVSDPVCGMELDPSRAASEVTWEGSTYWLCSPDCLQRFAASPHRFAGRS
jgi:adenylate cyclase